LAKGKDIKKLARNKIKQELRGCTFKPSLDRKSVHLASRTARASSDPKNLDALYSSLHNAHKEKMAKYEDLKKQKEVSEIEDCTFKPTISDTKTWSKKKAISRSTVELPTASARAK
jgi:hypothetical protein|tara:strand:+ start:226 stop:573 length:348 start_codon:yes stop_codon:yes gene_type:complete